MPCLLSTTDICNLALDYLEEAPLNSMDTDLGDMARWFRRNFWPMAHALLRKHPWNCAITRAQLSASATAPLFGWTYAYDFPPNCLRVLPLTIDGTENSKSAPHKIEGSQILTDLPAPLNMRFLRRIVQTGEFDDTFANFLAISLAQKAAHKLTGKQSYAQLMAQMAQAALTEAEQLDALEGTPDDPEDDFWISARQ